MALSKIISFAKKGYNNSLEPSCKKNQDKTPTQNPKNLNPLNPTGNPPQTVYLSMTDMKPYNTGNNLNVITKMTNYIPNNNSIPTKPKTSNLCSKKEQKSNTERPKTNSEGIPNNLINIKQNQNYYSKRKPENIFIDDDFGSEIDFFPFEVKATKISLEVPEVEGRPRSSPSSQKIKQIQTKSIAINTSSSLQGFNNFNKYNFHNIHLNVRNKGAEEVEEGDLIHREFESGNSLSSTFTCDHDNAEYHRNKILLGDASKKINGKKIRMRCTEGNQQDSKNRKIVFSGRNVARQGFFISGLEKEPAVGDVKKKKRVVKREKSMIMMTTVLLC